MPSLGSSKSFSSVSQSSASESAGDACLHYYENYGDPNPDCTGGYWDNWGAPEYEADHYNGRQMWTCNNPFGPTGTWYLWWDGTHWRVTDSLDLGNLSADHWLGGSGECPVDSNPFVGQGAFSGTFIFYVPT